MTDVVEMMLIGNTVVQLLVSGPMGRILDALKSLQLQSHLQLIDVKTPKIVVIFFSALMSLTNFNIVNIKSWF
jgi:hypothetical protein